MPLKYIKYLFDLRITKGKINTTDSFIKYKVEILVF